MDWCIVIDVAFLSHILILWIFVESNSLEMGNSTFSNNFTNRCRDKRCIWQQRTECFEATILINNGSASPFDFIVFCFITRVDSFDTFYCPYDDMFIIVVSIYSRAKSQFTMITHVLSCKLYKYLVPDYQYHVSSLDA